MRLLAVLQSFLLIAALFSPALALGATWTDQADYSPGSVVTISGDNSDGAGYLPGETVDVVVSGPNGYAASCTAIVSEIAEELGAWSCQVTLWDSALAVGDYSYTASGQTSGVAENGTFTDATNINTTTTLSASIAAIALGSSTTLSGSVTSAASGNPLATGQAIHLNLYTNSGCTTGTTLITDATGGGGTNTNNYSYVYTPTWTGTRYVKAVYDGTSTGSGSSAVNWRPSASSCVALTVDGPPSVASTTPSNGATGVATTANISITFNEPVALDGGWDGISCTSSGSHTAAVTGGPTIWTVNPDTDFVAGELCTFTVYGGSVHDADSIDPPDTMATNYAFSFTIDEPPSVTSTTPVNGAPGVAANSNIVVDFSEEIHFSGAWFTISCGTSGSHTAGNSANNSSSVTLNPDVDFTAGETCTVTIVAAQVNDTDGGDPPDTMVSNYVFSFTVFSSTVATTTTATDESAAYGDTNVTLHATVSPVSGPAVNTGTVTFTVNGNTLTPVAVTAGSASATLDLTGFGAGQYDIAVAYNAGFGFFGSDNSSQDPTPQLTISAGTLYVTPDNMTVTYGDAEPTYTLDVTGFISGENAGNAGGYVAPSCTSDYTAGTHVADSPRTITCSGGSADDYTFDYTATADLTINPAELTVTPDNQSVTYGDAKPADSFYTFGVTGWVLSETSAAASNYIAPTCTSDYTQGMHVADSTRDITCSGGSADDYTFDYAATADLTINPAELTVTPDNQSVTYGDVAPVDSFYAFNVTGFVLSEDALSADNYVAPTCSSDYTQGMHVADSTRDITCTGGSADDYAFDLDDTADLTINALELTPAFTVANKYWDGNTSATILTESATGQYNGDDCTLSGGSTAFPAIAVGDYTLALTGWSLTGADCLYDGIADYVISTDPTANASILAWDASGHGFYQPVGIANTVFTEAPATAPTTPGSTPWVVVKGGQTVPLKFNVYAGTVEKTSLSDIQSFNSARLQNCSGGVVTEDPIDFTTAGSTTLRYDATDMQWIQNWKTPKVTGEQCWRVWVTFADGSSLEAFFKLRK